MTALGELCLLTAFVASGYAAFAGLAGRSGNHPVLRSGALWAAVCAALALAATVAVLTWALVARDFRFQYVADYSDNLLPWHYALSALWVGQAGSLLVWAWFLAVLSLAFRLWPGNAAGELREPAFGLLMAYLCFLVAVMVFGADPMLPSVAPPAKGSGLSPLLQHPVMLVHPPIIFLGYAAWSVPFALAVAALLTTRMAGAERRGCEMGTELPPDASGEGERRTATTRPHFATSERCPSRGGTREAITTSPCTDIRHTECAGYDRLDAAWAKAARPWALFAWVVLGSGILLGAQWAYEVLGWGGYWSWDPVENGSLVPWLTGTALIHCLMAWKCAGVLKRTALGLALATFGLCNFATFLTRSGIFGSLHEFSRSPIGWLFLALMLAIALGGIALMVWRRSMLVPQRRISSIGSREAMICLGVLALVLLAVAALAGTTAAPLSRILLGRTIVVGQPFYNNVLVPTGLCLLAAMAAVPLLRWNASPSLSQKRLLLVAASAAVLAGIGAFAAGVRHPIALAVAGLATLSLVAPLAVLVGQVFNLPDPNGKLETCPTAGLLARYRRQYAGFLIHCGFACLAVGVTGSSLGTQRHELTMTRGETVAWTGRSILYVDLIEHELPDKLVVHAQLEISQEGTKPYVLLPAQVLYRSQNTWGTEVAIHSTWSEDFYTILHAGEGRETVNLTLIASPMVRWMWLAGWIGAAGAVIGLWPNRRHTPASARSVGSNGPALQRPHWTRAPQHQDAAHD